MVTCEGLAKVFKRRLAKQSEAVKALEQVSLSVDQGQIVGLIGPNGAGKTTTMRMLVGLSDADAGSAAVLGGPYQNLPNPGRRVGVLLEHGQPLFRVEFMRNEAVPDSLYGGRGSHYQGQGLRLAKQFRAT